MKPRTRKKSNIQNPIAVAMMLRYGKTVTGHGNKRIRRGQDARASWKNEAWS